jgi:hypothetical protein
MGAILKSAGEFVKDSAEMNTKKTYVCSIWPQGAIPSGTAPMVHGDVSVVLIGG